MDDDDPGDPVGEHGASPVKRLPQYAAWIRPHGRTLAAVLILSVIATGADMLHPLFMRHLIDNVLLAEDVSQASRLRSLHFVGLVFLAVIVIGETADACRLHGQRLLNVRLVLNLRRCLHEKLLELPLSTLSRLKTGGIVSRLGRDVDATTGLLQQAVVSPGVALLRLVVAVTILFVLNWKLACTAIAIIPAITCSSLIMVKRVRPVYRAIRTDAAQIDGRVSESFGGIRTVRAFCREATERQVFISAYHTMARMELFAHRREIILWSIWGFFLSLVSLVIVWFGGYLQLQSAASIGDIMAFQWYVLLLLNPVWRIVESLSELQRSLAATERVFDVLDTRPDKPDVPDAPAAPTTVEEIRFEHVWFAYRPGESVLKDVDLVVPGGSVTALVGRSGAGKSTLTDLVARFHDPERGRILFNGHDLRALSLRSYRRLLGVVQQDVFLFDDTVAENLRYGRRNATLEEIMAAAQRANAHEFIAALPDGYDSIIGERGIQLSGGQRQRLSIARALLADPAILILDEATSNLDTESEQLIQRSLRELFKGRTTFVIAHRLSTITHADRIVVMETGRIVETGSHQELLARQGVYCQMVRRQNMILKDS